MNSKRKFWTNIGSLALVAVLAVGGVIGVLSALNVQVSSTFSISYTAHNVHAIITGDYADSTGTQVGNLVNKADQTTQIVFSGEEDNGATKGFADKNDLVIKGPNDTVDIHYIVRNTGNDPFGLTMIFNSNLEQSNMQVRYSVQYWNGTDPQPKYVYNQQTLSQMYLTEAGTDNCCAVVGMQFSVVNQVQNAALNATMNFDLDSTAEKPKDGTLLQDWNAVRSKVFSFTQREEFAWDYGYSYWYANDDTNSITFDRFTSERVYNIDGKNVIEGIEPIDVQDGKIFAYKVPTGKNNSESKPIYDVYFLSKYEMLFDDNTFKNGFGCDDEGYARVFDGLEKLSFKSIDTTAMTTMDKLFGFKNDGHHINGDTGWRGTFKAKHMDLTGFDTENVTNMSYMFNNGYSSYVDITETIDLTGWDTSSVTNMNDMFSGCEELTKIIGIEDLDTHSVTNMDSMFAWCSGLNLLNLSGWNTGNVTDMFYMFYGCSNLSKIIGIEDFDTHNVIEVQHLFGSCTSLTTLDLRGWDTSSMDGSYIYLFDGCRNLQTVYVGSGWTLDDDRMFPSGCDVQHV